MATRKRPSASARGYNWAHRQMRLALTPTVDAGQANCTEVVCLMPSRWIRPGTYWDLAHNRVTGEWLGPAHRKCNRAEAARYKNRLRRQGIIARTRWASRRW